MSRSTEQHLRPWILHMKAIKKKVHCPHVQNPSSKWFCRYCETPCISCMKVGLLFRFSSCVNLRRTVAVAHILWWRVRLGWWIERNGFVTFFTHYDKSGAFFFQLCQGLCSAILLAQTMPVKYHRWLRGRLVINDHEGTRSDKVSRCNGDRAEEIEYRSS